MPGVTQIYPQPLIIGSRGQLGQALLKLSPNAIGLWREHIDLSKPNLSEALRPYLQRENNISGIINAAAYTNVDGAETHADLATRVNSNAVREIAEFCEERDLPFVHISTDYVFSGKAIEPYKTSQKTNPLNVYGQSKLEGEVAINGTGANAAILRTSWVYDSVNKNFLTTMLHLSKTREFLKVVGDQIGRPTYTEDLARAAVIALIEIKANPNKAGLYHVTNTGKPISWAQFAEAIFSVTKRNVTVSAIPSSEYPTAAARPAYSVLDTSKFEDVFNHELPDWRNGLNRATNLLH